MVRAISLLISLGVLAGCGDSPNRPWSRIPASRLPLAVERIVTDNGATIRAGESAIQWDGWSIQVTEGETATLHDGGCLAGHQVCRRLDGLTCGAPTGGEWLPCSITLSDLIEQADIACSVVQGDGSTPLPCPREIVLAGQD